MVTRPLLLSAGVPVPKKVYPLGQDPLKPGHLPRPPRGSRLEKTMDSCPDKVEIHLDPPPAPSLRALSHEPRDSSSPSGTLPGPSLSLHERSQASRAHIRYF